MFSHRCFRIAGHGVLALVAVAAVALLFGWVLMLAWNEVMPALFGLPAVTFVQAVAGLVLVRILVGRFTSGRHRGGGHRRPHGHGWRRWSHCCCDDDQALHAAWWEEEGKALFEAYAARRNGEAKQG